MDNIVSIEKNIPHKVSEVICINCKFRYISVRPAETKLTKLEYGRCGEQGFIIETGEELED